MKKSEYLNQVRGFTTWMAQHLSNDSKLAHHYYRPKAVAATRFDNLADALRKYAWPIAAAVRDGGAYADSLEANTRVLDRIQRALQATSSDDSMRDACIKVMQWGGVVNGNVPWLKKNTAGLALLVNEVSGLLGSDNDDIQLFPANLRFNAGMTKVYSLMVANFVIYDSRVAAALCWFVMHWALAGKLGAVPDALRFPCMPAKEGDNPELRKLRNPGAGALQFPALRNRARLHAQWNLRASWLLEAVLKEAGTATAFHQSPQPLRALEAALFMWGYDLGQNRPQSDGNNPVQCHSQSLP